MSRLYNSSSTQDTLSKTSFSFYELLNLYLWGNTSGMDDKLSESIPHMRTRSEISVEISLQSFMQECSGVINARDFQWVNLFFEDKTFEDIAAERSKSVYSEDIYPTSLSAELHRINPDVNPAEGYTKAEVIDAMKYMEITKVLSETIYQFLQRNEGETEEHYQNRSFI